MSSLIAGLFVASIASIAALAAACLITMQGAFSRAIKAFEEASDKNMTIMQGALAHIRATTTIGGTPIHVRELELQVENQKLQNDRAMVEAKVAMVRAAAGQPPPAHEKAA